MFSPQRSLLARSDSPPCRAGSRRLWLVSLPQRGVKQANQGRCSNRRRDRVPKLIFCSQCNSRHKTNELAFELQYFANQFSVKLGSPRISLISKNLTACLNRSTPILLNLSLREGNRALFDRMGSPCSILIFDRKAVFAGKGPGRIGYLPAGRVFDSSSIS